ncbi:MAG: hypothetical protein AB7R40_16730 [Nitrospiraceae bacterium]
MDENFPLPLYYRLQSSGYDVERISILGQRRIKDLKFGNLSSERTLFS